METVLLILLLIVTIYPLYRVLKLIVEFVENAVELLDECCDDWDI